VVFGAIRRHRATSAGFSARRPRGIGCGIAGRQVNRFEWAGGVFEEVGVGLVTGTESGLFSRQGTGRLRPLGSLGWAELRIKLGVGRTTGTKRRVRAGVREELMWPHAVARRAAESRWGVREGLGATAGVESGKGWDLQACDCPRHDG